MLFKNILDGQRFCLMGDTKSFTKIPTISFASEWGEHVINCVQVTVSDDEQESPKTEALFMHPDTEVEVV